MKLQLQSNGNRLITTPQPHSSLSLLGPDFLSTRGHYNCATIGLPISGLVISNHARQMTE